MNGANVLVKNPQLHGEHAFEMSENLPVQVIFLGILEMTTSIRAVPMTITNLMALFLTTKGMSTMIQLAQKDNLCPILGLRKVITGTTKTN